MDRGLSLFGQNPEYTARFEECIELALRFLSRPWDIYKNGSSAVRQTVLRLAFSEPLTFTPDGVYGTPKKTFPFKVLGGLSAKKCKMVRRKGKRLNSQFDSLTDEEITLLFETLELWEYHLVRSDMPSLECHDEHFRP